MKKIIIATKNSGKVKEFQAFFEKNGYEVLSLLDISGAPDIEETGSTFKENALLKAEGIANVLNEIVIADDSGLSVDALDGEPGIFSARYAGIHKNDLDNINKVLHELSGIQASKRTARFHCALALAVPSKSTIVVEGICEGHITKEPMGTNGFGYDPIFIPKELYQTMAQLSKEEKNKISHRAHALKKLREQINSSLVNLG
ncbi:XTP/dITP diphosphatase [Bacillus sp. DJP31]|uniref:XTP/dITP diphosphatase n=1 Tax=Bacillus sp. DJP31 TaxID=3409789 RepID=UPI003BB65764